MSSTHEGPEVVELLASRPVSYVEGTKSLLDHGEITQKSSPTKVSSQQSESQPEGLPSKPTIPRESATKLPETVAVHNDKVRYYYNKTLNLRSSVENMLGLLENVHTSTFAYLSQLPETGDYSVIGTLFELIATISTMIEWNSLNHSCYWEDFCRETKQLMFLLEKVNGIALKCSDTATYILTQAQRLFRGLVPENSIKIERAIAYCKSSDYVNEDTIAQNIHIEWKRPGDDIILSWHDPDGGLLSVPLKETGVGFRLRFLRHIIYHSRTCLESALKAFMKVNVILHLHIPIEKLERCQSVELKTLSQQEKAFLIKAKREFDSNLDRVWKMVSRFKYQAFHLLNYKGTFKQIRKTQKYGPATTATFISLKMGIDDLLLIRVMSAGMQLQAKNESFDFTVHPDRTEDIISFVEDLMTNGNTNSFKELQLLLAIIKGVLPTERKNLSDKERQSMGDEVSCILLHRHQLRRSLKKALETFAEHPAFQKMDKLKLLGPVHEASKREGERMFKQVAEADTSLLDEPNRENRENVLNNNDRAESVHWITLEGGIKVSLDALRGIITQCPITQTTKAYHDLSSDERVILAIRLVRHLLIVCANEQSWAKISYDRVMETKSLVKRLKSKDRMNQSLQNVILEQNKQIRQMLHLTKSMRFLRKYE